MTATTEEPERTVEVDGTECVVIPKEDYEGLKETVDDLQEELAQHKDHTGRELADVRGRISEVEEEVEEEPGSDGSNPGGNGPETPLERTASFPQSMLDEQSENVQRAVMIAAGIGTYVEYDKTPKGYMVTSGEIRKALERLDEDAHPTTRGRVMAYLDDLGKDHVEVVKKRGTKRVYFSPELVKRLKGISQCGDPGKPGTPAPSQSQAG